MDDSQKGFAPVVIILGVIALLGIGGGYFWFSNLKPQDPQLLIGLWRTESSIFPDGEYLEIKEKEFCFAWGGDSPAHFYCSQYAPYTVSKNLIGFGEQSKPNTKWKATGDTLTLWQFGEKKVYERVNSSGNATPKQILPSQAPKPSHPTEQTSNPTSATPTYAPKPPDTEKPKITSFNISPPSVEVGDTVTLTCVATDNSQFVQIELETFAELPGGSDRSYSGGGFGLSGDTKTHEHKIQFAGNYTATCKASDEAKNETQTNLTFSAM